MSTLVQIVVAVLVGFAGGTLMWVGTQDVFSGYVFQRQNYRNHQLPTGVGVLAALVVVVAVGAQVAAVELWSAVSGSGWAGWSAVGATGPVVAQIAVGFSLLGLIDDLGGMGESGGFSGHISAALHGRVTSGMVKLIGGPFITLVILSAAWPPLGRAGHLRDAAVICLAANLANLFDRAPGRVIKVAWLAYVVLIATTLHTGLVPIGVVMGAAIALLGLDLSERFMLGDAGANVLGAVLGVGSVMTTTEVQRWVLLAALLVANLVSEKVSFSRVIDSVGVLRRIDRLGAPHRPR